MLSDEDETALFREAMRGVRPLKTSGQISASRRGARGRARLARTSSVHGSPVPTGGAPRDRPGAADDRHPDKSGNPVSPGTDLYELQAGDELLFRRSGVSTLALRRLRRGQYRVQAEIDLHGCTLAEALPQLDAFLRESRSRGLHCVRIIHGKGLRSGNRGPVLKNSVNAQLRRAQGVMAFVSALPAAGGTGATLVLLSRS
ncbi:MAG TPA: Smr/MutS family protein [Steroidobacteraceae bacterium]|nr:Smr/MutS family protein [Steroidobacteraceae bacterium]